MLKILNLFIGIIIVVGLGIFYETINQENFTVNQDLQKLLPKLYYINLAHRQDRKTQLISQLKKIDYPEQNIIRINAILRDMGSTGCGLSHIKALEIALNQPHDLNYVLILEDDFIWKYGSSFTKHILRGALVSNVDWNVILLACNGDTHSYSKYLNKVKKCQTASGYLIKLDYIPKLLHIWKKDMEYREKHHIIKNSKVENKTCIDQSWKKLQHDNWFITKPILGKQGDSFSDIEKSYVRYGV